MSFHLSDRHLSFWEYLSALCVLVAVYVISNALVMGFVVGEDIEAFSQRLGSTVAFALLMFPWCVVCLAFFPVVKLLLNVNWRSMITSREKVDARRSFIAFVGWFALCTLSFCVTINDAIVFNFQPLTFSFLLLVSLIVLPLQCLAEELLFRSFLLKWIGRRMPIKAVQILLSGIIFGTLHASNPEVDALGFLAMLYYICTGILLGFVAVKDQGIELTFGFHLANNLFASLVLSKEWSLFQTDALYIDHNPPSFSFFDFMWTFALQLLFVLGCYLFSWRNSKADCGSSVVHDS